MGGFDESVKYLHFEPTRKATLVEARNNNIPFDKYYTLVKTRAIRRIPYTLVFPHASIVYDKSAGDPNRDGRISSIGEFHLSAPGPFYILGTDQNLQNYEPAALMIRWRSGNTVYRYIAAMSLAFFDNYAHVFRNAANYFPQKRYTNQLIAPNCVFEVWFPGTAPFYVNREYTLNLSILSLPPDANQLTVPITFTTHPYSELATPIPEFYPQDTTAQQWLDNP